MYFSRGYSPKLFFFLIVHFFTEYNPHSIIVQNLKILESISILLLAKNKQTKISIHCSSPSDVSFPHGAAKMAHSAKRYCSEVPNPSTWHREDGWQILSKDMLVYTRTVRTVFQINPFKKPQNNPTEIVRDKSPPPISPITKSS